MFGQLYDELEYPSAMFIRFVLSPASDTMLCIHHMYAVLDHKFTSVVYYDWLRLQLQQTKSSGI